MTVVQSEFEERAERIPPHGVGLSVDVYSPPLIELEEHLGREGLAADYLEVFHAAPDALASVVRRLPGRTFAYHGEGLWISQPEFWEHPHVERYISDACAQLRTLRSTWLNIECASKQMAGLAFGTYLPPLYTKPSAMVVADNAARLQRSLDRAFGGNSAPLLLLEMPPLTYFAYGALPIPRFFAELTSWAACGLVLDIGHLWTVYRYTGAWRQASLEQFVAAFLAQFPVERVVEIHLAGLAPHSWEAAPGAAPEGALPRWIDAHGAPIPAVLYDMLEWVLASRRLTHLKGVALEVDTKDTALIVSELAAFRRRFGDRIARLIHPLTRGPCPATWPAEDIEERGSVSSAEDRAEVSRQYQAYARLVMGQGSSEAPHQLNGGIDGEEGLNRYRRMYLPYEILHWGGDLADMFPRTCRALLDHQVDVRDFVRFWMERPSNMSEAYDFFLMKLERFVSFIAVSLPSAAELVAQEAEELRAAYQEANHHVIEVVG